MRREAAVNEVSSVLLIIFFLLVSGGTTRGHMPLYLTGISCWLPTISSTTFCLTFRSTRYYAITHTYLSSSGSATTNYWITPGRLPRYQFKESLANYRDILCFKAPSVVMQAFIVSYLCSRFHNRTCQAQDWDNSSKAYAENSNCNIIASYCSKLDKITIGAISI